MITLGDIRKAGEGMPDDTLVVIQIENEPVNVDVNVEFESVLQANEDVLVINAEINIDNGE